MDKNNWNGIIWEGVYQNWTSAQSLCTGTGFCSDRWINAACKKLLNYRSGRLAKENQSPISDRFSSLALLIAAENKNSKKRLSVVDFGGSVGTHYELLKSTLQDYSTIDYHIIETESTIIASKNLFSNDEKISFHGEFTSIPLNPTVCYSNSVLQYIDDWLEIVKKMLSVNPKYLLLDDFPAGNNDEFITIQNYYSSKMPHRFFNLKKAVEKIESLGYELIYKTRYFGPVLGNFSKWPMDNFGSNHRLDYASTLLFRAKPKQGSRDE